MLLSYYYYYYYCYYYYYLRCDEYCCQLQCKSREWRSVSSLTSRQLRWHQWMLTVLSSSSWHWGRGHRWWIAGRHAVSQLLLPALSTLCQLHTCQLPQPLSLHASVCKVANGTLNRVKEMEPRGAGDMKGVASRAGREKERGGEGRGERVIVDNCKDVQLHDAVCLILIPR